MNNWHGASKWMAAQSVMQPTSVAAMVLSAILLAWLPVPAIAAANATLQEEAAADYTRIVKQSFAEWDHRHHSYLEMEDINRLVENPRIAGAEAAAVVFIRGRLSTKADDGKPTRFTRDELLALTADHKGMLSFASLCAHLRSTTRELFLPNDPSLELFHQGHEGDCYLLSVVGAYLDRDPKALKAMFHAWPANEVDVRFAHGRKVTVPALTDAELLLGAKIGAEHGIWLSVLEKAYAILREQDGNKATGDLSAAETEVPSDIIGHGGQRKPVIEALTGHTVETFMWYKSASDLGEERAADFLKRTTEAKLLISLATAAKGKARDGIVLPPGMGAHHAYVVLAYDPAARKVSVFNPWGHTFKPKGPAGLETGYPTEHGVFAVPVGEFVHLFAVAVFETSKPLSPEPAPLKQPR